jgi:hypothetical protein
MQISNPRFLTATWVMQMGMATMEVNGEDGIGSVRLGPEQNKDTRTFYGIKRFLDWESREPIPELRLWPSEESTVSKDFKSPNHHEIRRKKRLQIPKMEDEDFLDNLQKWPGLYRDGLLKNTSESLNEALLSCVDMADSNSDMPKGYLSGFICCCLPVIKSSTDLDNLSIQDLIMENSMVVKRPEWDDSRDYHRRKEGDKTQKKIWDTTDVDLSFFEGYEISDSKKISIEPSRSKISSIKSQLLEKFDETQPVKEYRSMRVYSRLFYHVLNLIKGKGFSVSANSQIKIGNKIRSSKRERQCYMTDFGFGNMGVVVYKVPGRFVESESFWFRIFFIESEIEPLNFELCPIIATENLVNKFGHPVRRHFTHCFSFTADKLAFLSNLYLNSCGLRKMDLRPGAFALFFWSSFFSGTRLRKDIALIKFMTTASMASYSSIKPMVQKYLTGLRRRPIERCMLNLWISTIAEILDERSFGGSKYVSLLGSSDNLVDFVDLGNCHTLAYVNTETRNHQMNEALKDLSANRKKYKNSWEGTTGAQGPEEGKTWNLDALRTAIRLYFDRDDLKRPFREVPITFDELIERMEENREEFLDGSKSSYHFKPPSAFSNTVSNCLLVEEMKKAGLNDNPLDMFSFSSDVVEESGYSLAFQAIKPQHDNSPRPIVVQTSVAKVVNWPHQSLFGLINENSPTEMTSKSAFDQQMIVQSTSVVGKGMGVNDDMSGWSGTDHKEKFRFALDVMSEEGVIDSRTRDMVDRAMCLSDNLRICVPAANCTQRGMSRFYRRSRLMKLPLDEDSEDQGDHLRTGFGNQSHKRVGGFSREETKDFTYDPEYDELTNISDWFGVITMENGWMQGLFHSASSFVHDLEMNLFKVLIERQFENLTVRYLVHSDDKNIGIQGDLSEDAIKRISNINTNLPTMFGMSQSTSKASVTRIETPRKGARETFSEFLGSVTCQGLSYSSHSRQWAVMNACQHDNPYENVLSLISSHVNLLNLGESPVVAEFSLTECLSELERRFGIRASWKDREAWDTRGLKLGNTLEYLGYPAVSLIEFRALGTSGDKLFKLLKGGNKIGFQIENSPLFLTKKSLRKKLRTAIERLSEDHVMPESHIYGEIRRLTQMKGISKPQESGLGLLAMGIGARLGKWKVGDNIMKASELVSFSSPRDPLKTSSSLDPRMMPILSDDAKIMASELFSDPVLVFSEPRKEFFGFGDIRISQFDITSSFEEVKEAMSHGGYVNPVSRSTFKRLIQQVEGFKRAYHLITKEGLLSLESIWEMHRTQNRFSHIISNQFSGLISFPHQGIEINVDKVRGKRLLPQVNSFTSRITTKDLSRDPFAFLSRVQSEINSACVSILLGKSKEVSVFRRITELAKSADLPTSLSTRGVPSSTQKLVRSILGGSFNFETSFLAFKGEEDNILKYDHFSGNRLVNLILIDDEEKMFSIQTNLEVTRELVIKRFPGFIEHEFSGEKAILGEEWGASMSVLRQAKDGSIETGPIKTTGSIKIHAEIPRTPSASNFDVVSFLGVIEIYSERSYKVIPGSLRTPCNGIHGRNSWNDRKMLERIRNKLSLPDCTKDHEDMMIPCFCRHQNLVIRSDKPRSDSNIVKLIAETLEETEEESAILWHDVSGLIRGVLDPSMEGMESEVFLSQVGFHSMVAVYYELSQHEREWDDSHVTHIEIDMDSEKMRYEVTQNGIDTEYEKEFKDLGCWMMSDGRKTEGDLCLENPQEDPLVTLFSSDELLILEMVKSRMKLPRRIGNTDVFNFLNSFIGGSLSREIVSPKLIFSSKSDMENCFKGTKQLPINEKYKFLREEFRNRADYSQFNQQGKFPYKVVRERALSDSYMTSRFSGKPSPKYWEMMMSLDTLDHSMPFTNEIRGILEVSRDPRMGSLHWKHSNDDLIPAMERKSFEILSLIDLSGLGKLLLEEWDQISVGDFNIWSTFSLIWSGSVRPSHSSIILPKNWIFQALNKIPKENWNLKIVRHIQIRPGANSIWTLYGDWQKQLPIWSNHLKRHLIWVPSVQSDKTPTSKEVLDDWNFMCLKVCEMSGSRNLTGFSLSEAMSKMSLDLGKSIILLKAADESYESRDLARALAVGFKGLEEVVSGEMEKLFLKEFPRLRETNTGAGPEKSVYEMYSVPYIESHITRPVTRTKVIYQTHKGMFDQPFHPMFPMFFDGSSKTQGARNFITLIPRNLIPLDLREELETLKATCSILPNQGPQKTEGVLDMIRPVCSQRLTRCIEDLLN